MREPPGPERVPSYLPRPPLSPQPHAATPLHLPPHTPALHFCHLVPSPQPPFSLTSPINICGGGEREGWGWGGGEGLSSTPCYPTPHPNLTHTNPLSPSHFSRSFFFFTFFCIFCSTRQVSLKIQLCKSGAGEAVEYAL